MDSPGEASWAPAVLNDTDLLRAVLRAFGTGMT